MANPFSGLENIGQSYLQGVQLANQRQARQDAIAQRAEEARVRERYYQDLVDQRREAAALAAKNREDILKEKFGEGLVYEADGVTIDLVKSAKNAKSIKDLDALAAAAGKANILQQASGFGDKLEIPEELMKRPAFNQGRAEGLVSVSETRLKMPGIMASQGWAPIPEDLEPTITGTGANDSEMIAELEAAGKPAANRKAYQGNADMDIRTVFGQRYGKPKKVAEQKAPKVEYPGTMKIQTDEGDLTVKLTPQQLAERLSRLGAPPASGAGTNAAPVGRIFYDPNAPFGAGYAPLK
jgi:hypothetical protein